MYHDPMKRPKYLNLFEIRQPLPAVLSILHRISGAGLFLTLPLLIWALQLSLGSPEGYEDVRSAAGNPLARLPLLVLLWASIHHFCAGLRALLLDIHVGVEKAQALVSAWVVLAVSLLLTAVLGARLW
ncbi:MAG: succinate dehydrogenase, cytochrome b556 subunit [Candidatus Nitricoxidivorans perseverans]|uniref:Succinate dehydrogenase cytochrome b556 subunit n=1 Tax=Candidatus Nitricoxidivorans perseverans TaxID=2975601 RepID=A0AA49FND6_9PROT|nr:MAG: succinate dehydrogenase, cytochrome b556 subunit [Candidatus Nitricoxidivorans perseverans]